MKREIINMKIRYRFNDDDMGFWEEQAGNFDAVVDEEEENEIMNCTDLKTQFEINKIKLGSLF